MRELHTPIPVIVYSRGVDVSREIRKETTQFLFQLLAAVFVVRVFKAVVSHQVRAARQLALF